MTDDELITEQEWFNRMMRKKIYDVIMVDWGNATTRVMDRYSCAIYDATSVVVGNKNWIKLHKLE